MKKHGFIVSALVVMVIGLLGSCISLQDRPITAEEMARFEKVGTVSVTFTTYQPLHIILKSVVRKTAYKKLLQQAKKTYMGEIDVNRIDIRNIDMQGRASALNIYPISITTLVFFANWQKVTATGDVIIDSSDSRSSINATSKGIEGAIFRAAEQFIKKLPDNARVAILSISTDDDEDYIIGTLEKTLLDLGAGFTIVDRRSQDAIQNEQAFITSGEVNIDTAASIGNALGATTVITGSTSRRDTTKLLTLRALDVESRTVVSTAMEPF